MTIFIDASAIMAVIAREPEAHIFVNRIEREKERLTSATAIWEATRSLPEVRGGMAFEEARAVVADFVRAADINIVAIGEEEGVLALDAYHRFGKGRHPARLNFGDCFAYACAKRRDIPLLFKGDDFSRTDIRDATLE